MSEDEAFGELLAAVREIAPVIEQHRRESDQNRRQAREVVECFYDRDLFRILLPQELGGRGLDLANWLRLVEEVSSYDGSAGWNFAIGSGSTPLAVSFMSPDLARSVCTQRGSYVAGSLAPVGKAIAVPDGYRVSGHFAWASGVHQASWVMVGCRVLDNAGAPLPGAPFALIPVGDVTIIDAWDVGGMRGTGSTELTVEDVFVPEERMLIRHSELADSAPIFRLGNLQFGVPFAAVALGIARGAIEALIELAINKESRGTSGSVLRDRIAVQYDVAKAQALVGSAKSYLLEAVGDVWRIAANNEPIADEQRALVRRAQVHAAESSVTAVDMMYRLAGGDALVQYGPFETALRDIHALQAQVMLQPSIMEAAGRVSLGLQPEMRGF